MYSNANPRNSTVLFQFTVVILLKQIIRCPFRYIYIYICIFFIIIILRVALLINNQRMWLIFDRTYSFEIFKVLKQNPCILYLINNFENSVAKIAKESFSTFNGFSFVRFFFVNGKFL